jgi:hypothetical protein
VHDEDGGDLVLRIVAESLLDRRGVDRVARAIRRADDAPARRLEELRPSLREVPVDGMSAASPGASRFSLTASQTPWPFAA